MKSIWDHRLVRWAVYLVCFVLVAVAAVTFLRYAFRWFAPFLAALVLSWIANPLVRFLEKRLRLSRKIASLLSIVIILVTLGAVLYFVGYRVFAEIRQLAAQLPELQGKIYTMTDRVEDMLNNLPPDILAFISDAVKNLDATLTEAVTNLAVSLTSRVYSMAKSVPTMLFSLVVTILSTYFFLSDRERIFDILKEVLPKAWLERIPLLKKRLSGSLFGYLRAQAILMSITFFLLLIGFTLMGNQYAIVTALLVALIDAIPVFGTGTVLIPLAVLNLISGHYGMMVAFLALYLVCMLTRQFLEPKIVGENIGLHPVLTLMAIYVGFRIFSVPGMILGPILAVLAAGIIRSGFFASEEEAAEETSE